MINYPLLIFIYSPIFVLLSIAILLKDRFVHKNEIFALHKWSLIPVAIIVGFAISNVIVASLWGLGLFPILKNYEYYNLANFSIFTFLWEILILVSIYLYLRFGYKASIKEVFNLFNLKLVYFPFILKVCGILTLINLLSIYLLDTNLLAGLDKVEVENMKSMNIVGNVVYLVGIIVSGPIVEEILFRGLLFAPLFRKVGQLMAIIISSAVWTHWHFVYSTQLVPSIGIFIIGVILAWLYARSGSLLHPIILHMFKNSWVIFYYF